MSFSKNELESLIEQVETSQIKARQRAIIAVLIPTVAAILYLGFTSWLIYGKQQELQDLEKNLNDRKTELNKVETQLTQVEQTLIQRDEQLKKTTTMIEQQTAQIKQAKIDSFQGNIAAAQERIANINTNFKENEVNGFRAILEGDLETARSLFKAAYDAYPTYHNVDEIYHRVLTDELVRAYSLASSSEKQSIQRQIMREIVEKYSWGMPEDLLSAMKKRLSI